MRRDTAPGWVVGRRGWVIPWFALAIALAGTFVVDRHWKDDLDDQRATAQRRADGVSASFADALGKMIAARLGALAAPRMRFTPIENAVSEPTFTAALDSVTLTLEGLTAVSAVTPDGRITRGTDALLGRAGLRPDVDTVVGAPLARALSTRAPASSGIVPAYNGRRVFYFEPVLRADTVLGALVAELDPQIIFRAAAQSAPPDDFTAGVGLFGPFGTQVNTLRVPAGWRTVDRPLRVADHDWLLRVAYPPPDPRPIAAARIATWITGIALGIALAAVLGALRRVVGSQSQEIRRREMAEAQARQAALDAVHSEREAHELTLQLEAAHSAAQRLSTSLDPDYVLEFFLGAVGETLDADTASLYTFDEEGDFLVGRKRLVLREVPAYTERLLGEDIRAVRVPVAMLPQLAEAVSTGEPVVMADAASMSGGRGLPGGVETAAAWVTIPLQVGGHMMGVAIWEVFRGAQPFDPKDVAFAQALAAQAAAALRTAELYASLERVSARATREATRFAAVLDQMADGVVLVDGAGRLERYNAAAERMLGAPPDSSSAAEWAAGLSLQTPDHRTLDPREIPLQRALRGERVARMSFLTEAEDGSERHLSASAAPIVPDVQGGDGDAAGAAMVVRDVTDEQQYAGMLRHTNQELRKQAALLEEINQQLREATAAKDRFLAVMSHELRTPLNAVIGYADLLDLQIKGPLNPNQQHMVRRVIETARHLLALIDEVLDLAKVGAGHVELKLEPIDLHEVLDLALDQVTPLAQAKGLALERERRDGSVRAVADRTRLTQVILNLLSNAVKFTEKGSVTIAARRNGGEQVELCVRDTGRGIRKDLQERIFEEFYQVEDGLTRSAGGTGLGLAIARRYARLMGGDLTVASELGEGAEFTVSLPAA